MRSRLEGPPTFSFSSVTSETLAKLNITFTSFLRLKDDLQERITKTTSRGSANFWNSENFYRHLLCLEGLVARTNEATARAWIDAFFFRASAMMAPDARMIVDMEHAIPATTVSPSSLATLSGYVAMVTTSRNAPIILNNPHINMWQSIRPCTFFIVEAKFSGANSPDYVAQAVSEMYASGKQFKTKFIRGAVTNGRAWVFIHLKFTDDYEGASFSQSDVIEWTATPDPDGTKVISKPWPDTVAAILADWIQASFVEIGDDDWFAPI